MIVRARALTPVGERQVAMVPFGTLPTTSRPPFRAREITAPQAADPGRAGPMPRPLPDGHLASPITVLRRNAMRYHVFAERTSEPTVR